MNFDDTQSKTLELDAVILSGYNQHTTLAK